MKKRLKKKKRMSDFCEKLSDVDYTKNKNNNNDNNNNINQR